MMSIPSLRPSLSEALACALPFALLSFSLLVSSLSHSALVGRDLDGNMATFEAYYDDVLDITWLADANYAQTSGHDADGFMNWADANAWVAGLTLGGYTDWRLANTNPIDGTTADDASFSNIGSEDGGYNVSAPGTAFAGSTASEMAHLFHNTLGNLGFCDPNTSTVFSCSGSQPGWGLTNTGPFSNVQASNYWSATEYAPNTFQAWGFNFGSGRQGSHYETNLLYAWAVRTGDVGASPVPVPAAVWLFGSGLLGLMGLKRRR